MPEVNINAIAMSDSVIDPELVLFVARGTQKGLPGRDMWLTEIAYDGPPYPYVHLTQSAQDVVAQLGSVRT